MMELIEIGLGIEIHRNDRMGIEIHRNDRMGIEIHRMMKE